MGAPQQFWEQVSNNLTMSHKGHMKDIPPIYVIQDDIPTTLSMLDHNILTYPPHKMVLKCSLDHLVQQIR